MTECLPAPSPSAFLPSFPPSLSSPLSLTPSYPPFFSHPLASQAWNSELLQPGSTSAPPQPRCRLSMCCSQWAWDGPTRDSDIRVQHDQRSHVSVSVQQQQQQQQHQQHQHQQHQR
eukprot:267170-Rhodomonas_salina.3